jgi:DNA (cytosine-5)-methyltransferase 1
MNVLDLFSGIGGFSLGLERAGMKTVAFCEVDKKCQAVLKKHWPGVPIFDDISNLKGEDIEETVDVICGGFPCQDISLAGKGAGLEGSRSGLWSEFKRLIEEIKPKYAIIENVSALRSRGLDQVLREISEIGYDAEWHCITAASIGAPHRRDRIWIVAYPRNSTGRDSITGSLGRDGERELEERVRTSETTETTGSSETSETLSNSNSEGLQGQWEITGRISKELQDISYSRWWQVEPDVGRVAHGIPNRVDRLKQLGNAVVPQIPELIGRAICQVG